MTTDIGKYQGLVIGLAIVIMTMLYAKNNKLNIPALFGLLVIIILTFAFPLFGFVLIIPITFIVYQESYKQIGAWYAKIQTIKFVDDK